MLTLSSWWLRVYFAVDPREGVVPYHSIHIPRISKANIYFLCDEYDYPSPTLTYTPVPVPVCTCEHVWCTIYTHRHTIELPWLEYIDSWIDILAEISQI